MCVVCMCVCETESVCVCVCVRARARGHEFMECEYMGMHNMSVIVRNVSACVGVSSCYVSVSASARECECMDM